MLQREREALRWPEVAFLSSLSFSSLSSSSDPMWCETLKSFNYQQLLGIHWMHEDQKGGKKRVRIRMSREEWKRERVFDALVHSSADKTEQHFDCCSKGAHHLERSSVAVLWMGSSAFVWPQSKNMALWWCSPPAPPSLSLPCISLLSNHAQKRLFHLKMSHITPFSFHPLNSLQHSGRGWMVSVRFVRISNKFELRPKG